MMQRHSVAIAVFALLTAGTLFSHDEVEPGTGGAGAPVGATTASACADGDAGGFTCSSVDLLARIPLAEFSTAPATASDVWGYLDLNTFREYAVITLRNGTAIVDVTEPDHPHEIATIGGAATTWRDVKVLQRWNGSSFEAYAYVTAEQVGEQLTIIDLSGLPERVELVGRFGDFLNAHNIYLSAIDYGTGLENAGRAAQAIIAGSSVAGGRFRAFSLTDPRQPMLSGAGSLPEYMHDAASLELDDARCPSPPCHVLLDFNENNLLVWDITNPLNPLGISSTSYANLGYVHSGWWTEDRRYVYVHDELDELDFGLNTQVRVFDIADLNTPVLAGTWLGPTAAIDHNGMVRGNRYYLSNYTRGLTVLDISDPVNPQAVGQFDTYPTDDSTSFNGAWGVYPFLPSGHILISDIQGGLFVLGDDTLETPAGQLGFAAPVAAATEGSAAQVEVARTHGSTGAITIDYEAIPASADALDFGPVARGTLSWTDGDTASKPISIPIEADAIAEENELLLLRLSNPTGGATIESGLGLTPLYIHDIGAPASVSFRAATLSALETHHGAVAVVERRGSLAAAISVDVSIVAGSAAADIDYLDFGIRTLSWAAGDGRPQTVTVELVDDGVAESSETLELQLANPIGASIDTAALTVQVDDGAPGTPQPPPGPGNPPPSGGGGGGGGSGGIPTLLMLAAIWIRWRRERRRRPTSDVWLARNETGAAEAAPARSR